MNILIFALALVLSIASCVPSILAAQTITVIVAPQGRLEYDPPYVRMGPGDTVVFVFQDARHSVTQTRDDLSEPCTKLPVGSDTGVRPATLGQKEDHGFTLYPEYDGSPRYFFSATHCQDGMVFAINPPPGGLDDYRAAAISTGKNDTPAPAPPPQPNPPPPTTATITVGGGVTTVITTPEPSPNPQQPPSNPETAVSSIANAPPAASIASGTPSGTSQAAANPSASQSPRPVAPGQPYEHIIGVGDDGLLTFSPVRIQALVGDIVTFEIRSDNHSIVQSTFDNPCQPLVKDDGNLGFRSGLLSAGNQTSGQLPRYSVRVNDTASIYVYDGQTQHCQSGMVFAVNVEAEQFTTFQRSAQLGPSSSQSEDSGSLVLRAVATWILPLLLSIVVVPSVL